MKNRIQSHLGTVRLTGALHSETTPRDNVKPAPVCGWKQNVNPELNALYPQIDEDECRFRVN